MAPRPVNHQTTVTAVSTVASAKTKIYCKEQNLLDIGALCLLSFEPLLYSDYPVNSEKRQDLNSRMWLWYKINNKLSS